MAAQFTFLDPLSRSGSGIQACTGPVLGDGKDCHDEQIGLGDHNSRDTELGPVTGCRTDDRLIPMWGQEPETDGHRSLGPPSGSFGHGSGSSEPPER